MKEFLRMPFHLALLSIALLAGAATAAEPADASAESGRRALVAQTEAWNKGDLEGALEGYCPKVDITWVNAKGVTHGYDAFAKSMREDFAGGTAAMGVLTNTVIDSRGLGGGQSLIVVKWDITRDGTRLMGGISTQLWAKCQGRTRIVFEHAD